MWFTYGICQPAGWFRASRNARNKRIRITAARPISAEKTNARRESSEIRSVPYSRGCLLTRPSNQVRHQRQVLLRVGGACPSRQLRRATEQGKELIDAELFRHASSVSSHWAGGFPNSRHRPRYF